MGNDDHDVDTADDEHDAGTGEETGRYCDGFHTLPLSSTVSRRPTHRLQSSSSLGLPYRILNINHKKELLRSLWVVTALFRTPTRLRPITFVTFLAFQDRAQRLHPNNLSSTNQTLNPTPNAMKPSCKSVNHD